MSVSQPLLVFPSQSAKPALHVGEHAPETHAVWPFGLVQALPQPPQLLTLWSRLTSQPFAGLVSQSAYPALHEVTTHCPALQAEPAFDRLQTLPQYPQLFGSDSTLVSQKVAGLLSHSPFP